MIDYQRTPQTWNLDGTYIRYAVSGCITPVGAAVLYLRGVERTLRSQSHGRDPPVDRGLYLLFTYKYRYIILAALPTHNFVHCHLTNYNVTMHYMITKETRHDYSIEVSWIPSDSTVRSVCKCPCKSIFFATHRKSFCLRTPE